VIPELAQPAIAKDVRSGPDVIVSAETVEVKATLFLDWVAVYEKGATRRRFRSCKLWTPVAVVRSGGGTTGADPMGGSRKKPDASFSGGGRSFCREREAWTE